MESLLTFIDTFLLSILESGAVIILAALLLGTVVKRWVPDKALRNKWIPTVNIVMGGILGVAIPTCFPAVGTATQVIYGAMCGLSASFLYDKVITHFSGGLKSTVETES